MPIQRPSKWAGFTLIELLVAIGVMALMAGLTWRGLDGMTRAQSLVQTRADKVLALQAGLAQWSADLDAMQQLLGSDGVDWDGKSLRLTRRSSADLGSAVMVVAWSRREIEGGAHWIRWQSAPVSTRADLQTAWARAAQWGQNPSDAERRLEVPLFPLQEWRVFYFRGDTWSNPLSSDNAVPPPVAQGANPTGPPVTAPGSTLPDGIRVVLTVPEGQAVSGTITRDWARPSLSGSK